MDLGFQVFLEGEKSFKSRKGEASSLLTSSIIKAGS